MFINFVPTTCQKSSLRSETRLPALLLTFFNNNYYLQCHACHEISNLEKPFYKNIKI